MRISNSFFFRFAENAQLPAQRVQPSQSIILQKQHLTRIATARAAVVPALHPSPSLVTRFGLRLMALHSWFRISAITSARVATVLLLNHVA